MRSRAINGLAGSLKLGIEKAEIERGIVNDERCVAEKSNQIVGHFGEEGFILEELLAQAVNGERFRRHAALRIEIGVECLSGRYAIDQLDAADLHQTVAVQRIETGGLGIEHNLAHEQRPRTGVSDIARRITGAAAAF